MCHRLLGDAKFFALQLRFDHDLAEQVRRGGCEVCGGRLDRSSYPRKPRGATAALPDEYRERESFCCAVDGCRKRHTPASIRFLGRRVYLGAVVVLATAMQQGVTPLRASRLRDALGVSLRTLARWREWWLTAFAECAFWKTARARFATPVETNRLPLSLLERFGADEDAALAALLKLLAPLSTPEGHVPDQRL